jgi:hypothetical protein
MGLVSAELGLENSCAVYNNSLLHDVLRWILVVMPLEPPSLTS